MYTQIYSMVESPLWWFRFVGCSSLAICSFLCAQSMNRTYSSIWLHRSQVYDSINTMDGKCVAAYFYIVYTNTNTHTSCNISTVSLRRTKNKQVTRQHLLPYNIIPMLCTRGKGVSVFMYQHKGKNAVFICRNRKKTEKKNASITACIYSNQI